MITIKSRRMIVPPEERFLGVETDTNSSVRVFQIPRHSANDMDLSALAFFLDIRYENGITNEDTFTDVVVSDKYIQLTWTITAGALGGEGAIFLQLKANDASGNVKWRSIIEPFAVGDCIDGSGSYTGDLSAYEALVTRCVLIENGEILRVAHEEARETVAASQASAEAARVLAEGLRVIAEQARVSSFNDITSRYQAAISENTLIELTAARGSFANLVARLNKSDELLAQNTHINVKTEGAIGDGSDASTAFTNAITKAISQGKSKIYIPSGTYTLDNVVLQNPDMIFEGESRTTTIIKIKSTAECIFDLGVKNYNPTTIAELFAGNAQNTHFRNITFKYDDEYNISYTGSRTKYAIRDNGSGGTILYNCDFIGFKYGFMGVFGSDFSSADLCRAHHCDYGIYFGQGSQQINLSRLQFYLCGEGLVLQWVKHISLRDVYFIENKNYDITIPLNNTGYDSIPQIYRPTMLNIETDDSWFETGAGYNTGWDHPHHVYIYGDCTESPQGMKFRNNTLISGTSGMGTKNVATNYSFIRLESKGTNIKVEDTYYYGDRIDAVVSIATGYYPGVKQRNTRVTDGYTVKPVFNTWSIGTEYYDEVNRIYKSLAASLNYEFQDSSTNRKFRQSFDGNSVVTFSVHDGTAYRDRIKFDIMNAFVILNDQIIRFGSAAPTGGTYSKGDVIFNNNPSELGTAGSKYVISGWKCLTAGTPGTWVEMRTLTGN